MSEFLKKNRGFLKIFQNRILWVANFWKFEVPQKNLGPIGSAVLTFIGYKQTNRHPDRQVKYIYIDIENSNVYVGK